MAKAVMESFPLIPNVNFECSKKYMKQERIELALEILEASEACTTKLVQPNLDMFALAGWPNPKHTRWL